MHRRHARFADPLEGPEDALLVFLGDAHAGVADGELGDLVAVADMQYHPALAGEFDGVGQQVDQHLAQALLIGGHPFGDAPLAVELKADAFFFGLQLEHGDQLVDQ